MAQGIKDVVFDQTGGDMIATFHTVSTSSATVIEGPVKVAVPDLITQACVLGHMGFPGMKALDPADPATGRILQEDGMSAGHCLLDVKIFQSHIADQIDGPCFCQSPRWNIQQSYQNPEIDPYSAPCAYLWWSCGGSRSYQVSLPCRNLMPARWSGYLIETLNENSFHLSLILILIPNGVILNLTVPGLLQLNGCSYLEYQVRKDLKVG